MHSQTFSFWMRKRHFCFGASFRGQPSTLHQPLAPALARDLVAVWIHEGLRRDHWVRWHMIALHQDIELSSGVYHRMSDDRLSAWLLCQVRDARVMVFEVLPKMGAEQSWAEYGRLVDAPVVPVVETDLEVEEPTDDRPYHRYRVPFDNGLLPDRLAPECPHPSFRSESTATAQSAVLAWLRRYDLPENWNNTLGGEGGGFMATTTRVVEVKAGTIVYRYYGGKAKPLGVWWFFHCYAGDPKQFAALPPECSANYMVKARLKKTTPTLMGIGAPRCTNKPGGPIQCRAPYQSAHDNPEKLENDYLEIL